MDKNENVSENKSNWAKQTRSVNLLFQKCHNQVWAYLTWVKKNTNPDYAQLLLFE